MPVNVTVLIVDLTGESRVITGPRAGFTVHTRHAWREGISIGLTPAGTAALLGVPARHLVGETVELADVLGPREAALAERLAVASGWASRFALLDQELISRLGDRGPADMLVARAWTRLQQPGPRIGIDRLAGRLGISRRYLEVRFQREIGLAPRSVARIARLQHAVGRLVRPTGLAAIATDCGYADQAHFTRDVRTMTGLTPTQLCALLQYEELTPPVASGT